MTTPPKRKSRAHEDHDRQPLPSPPRDYLWPPVTADHFQWSPGMELWRWETHETDSPVLVCIRVASVDFCNPPSYRARRGAPLIAWSETYANKSAALQNKPDRQE